MKINAIESSVDGKFFATASSEGNTVRFGKAANGEPVTAPLRHGASAIGGTLDELTRLAQALSGRRFDASDVLVDIASMRVAELVRDVNALSAHRTHADAAIGLAPDSCRNGQAR